MKQVSELIGAELDYWVAKAEGLEQPTIDDDSGKRACLYVHHEEPGDDGWWSGYYPSTDWAEGGPIIERERMNFATLGTGPRGANGYEPVVAIPYDGRRALEGETHLIAAMRAYVALKFGSTVDDAQESEGSGE